MQLRAVAGGKNATVNMLCLFEVEKGCASVDQIPWNLANGKALHHPSTHGFHAQAEPTHTLWICTACMWTRP